MKSVSIAQAKAHLSEIVDQVVAGESVQITRRGKPVATISPTVREKKPIDFEAMKAVSDRVRKQPVTAGEFMRWLRDTDRY